jgi:hypothetical protein
MTVSTNSDWTQTVGQICLSAAMELGAVGLGDSLEASEELEMTTRLNSMLAKWSIDANLFRETTGRSPSRAEPEPQHCPPHPRCPQHPLRPELDQQAHARGVEPRRVFPASQPHAGRRFADDRLFQQADRRRGSLSVACPGCGCRSRAGLQPLVLLRRRAGAGTGYPAGVARGGAIRPRLTVRGHLRDHAARSGKGQRCDTQARTSYERMLDATVPTAIISSTISPSRFANGPGDRPRRMAAQARRSRAVAAGKLPSRAGQDRSQGLEHPLAPAAGFLCLESARADRRASSRNPACSTATSSTSATARSTARGLLRFDRRHRRGHLGRWHRRDRYHPRRKARGRITARTLPRSPFPMAPGQQRPLDGPPLRLCAQGQRALLLVGS